MILDTNALSAWWNDDNAIVRVIETATQIYVPVPALAEFRFGVCQSRKREIMESWMQRALTSTHILCIDDATTFHYAELRLALKMRGTPIPMNDLWIAAIARQHSLPIVSRDTHFDLVEGIQRIAF